MNQENQRPSDEELNARFEAVMQQRNNSMNQNVIDAGIIAELKTQLAKANEALKQLEKAEEVD
jgi:hypothetical protein